MVILSRRMTQQRGSTMNQQFFTILLVALFLLILGCQDQLTESDVQRIREQGTTGPQGRAWSSRASGRTRIHRADRRRLTYHFGMGAGRPKPTSYHICADLNGDASSSSTDLNGDASSSSTDLNGDASSSSTDLNGDASSSSTDLNDPPYAWCS